MESVYLFRDPLIISFVLIMKFLSNICSRAVNLLHFSFMCIFCLALVNLKIVEFILFLFIVIVGSELSGLMIPSLSVFIRLLFV
jgi:hypothetical protein